MKNVKLYTKGVVLDTDGPGGWCSVLEYQGKEKELHGSEQQSSIKRISMQPIIVGLSALKEPCSVEVYTDCVFIINSIRYGWLNKWANGGWMKNNKEPVTDRDLLEQLASLLSVHTVAFKWETPVGNRMLKRCENVAKSCVRLAISTMHEWLVEDNHAQMLLLIGNKYWLADYEVHQSGDEKLMLVRDAQHKLELFYHQCSNGVDTNYAEINQKASGMGINLHEVYRYIKDNNPLTKGE